ncbi:MAG: aminodeoxychorismate synthase, component I [Syntrophus sp. (in: bacteria)]|nr:aminodeoxychorismate synthase, component I [Syntrophus sp. (in: bacteria)]
MNQAVIHDPESGHWLQFTRPHVILQTANPSDVIPLLAEAERLVRHDGLYAAGWISYEASPAFDHAFRTRTATAFPLVCFGLFNPPTLLKALPAAGDQTPSATSWKPSVDRDEYDAAITRIRNHIASGDTYQVNYTLRQWSGFQGDPWEFFLRTCTDAPYGAFLDADPYFLCSASPELFFSLRGGRIFSKPMKGTAARGRTLAEDDNNARWLYESEKNRAENVMIVDMIRNDLGRIARPGSVVVPRLYDIEKYATVWQMTSTVEALTAASLPEILQALFPCASITGAPKVKTMEIISALETTPRNIYTGAIGFFGPNRHARFSVAIRTTLIDTHACQAEYGVGGGIVWDSTAQEEYEECLNKAKIILDPISPRPFQLLETLLWTRDEGYFLESRHHERLRASALYFDYPYDDRRIRKALSGVVEDHPPGHLRVRLLLSKDGTVECRATPLPQTDGLPLKIRLARNPVVSHDPFLFHKTTRREIYEQAKTAFPDADDVLLYNEAGDVTESCIANVVILRNGRLVTPPVRCGLLNGVYRQELLDRGEISEETVDLSALRRAEKIFLINSVRKWREAVLPPEDLLL